MKNIRAFLSENFQFFGGEIYYIFEQACFRNELQCFIEIHVFNAKSVHLDQTPHSAASTVSDLDIL